MGNKALMVLLVMLMLPPYLLCIFSSLFFPFPIFSALLLPLVLLH